MINNNILNLRNSAGDQKLLEATNIRLNLRAVVHSVDGNKEMYLDPMANESLSYDSKPNFARTRKRSRFIWALKRSPHVFSKSQESFGLETYSSVVVFKNNAINMELGQSEIGRMIGVVSHLVPGVAWSWVKG